MPDVAAMMARVAPLWLLVLVVSAAALTLVLLYLLFRWALHRVGDALDNSRQRVAIGVLATGVVLLFAAHWIPALSASFPGVPTFSTPVTQTYARQVRFVIDALGGSRSLAPSPPMNADLRLVRGADVFLVFIEAYGAVTYERPDIAPRLAVSRADLEAAIRSTNRGVVSAFVESPTFGGSSWLAHLSLMSGVEVRDAETNARLMTQQRETMVTTFARRGYRTVGPRCRAPSGRERDGRSAGRGAAGAARDGHAPRGDALSARGARPRVMIRLGDQRPAPGGRGEGAPGDAPREEAH